GSCWEFSSFSSLAFNSVQSSASRARENSEILPAKELISIVSLRDLLIETGIDLFFRQFFYPLNDVFLSPVPPRGAVLGNVQRQDLAKQIFRQRINGRVIKHRSRREVTF